MLTTVAAAFLAMSALVPIGETQADTAPDFVTVEVKTVNGSDCTAVSAAHAPPPDRTAFTDTYSQFLAQAGPGSDPTDIRKNCQLVIQVNYPQGFTFGIAKADYRGFAHLLTGA